MGLSIMVIIIIATTLLGFPLFFSFLLGCIAFFVSTPGLDVMMLPDYESGRDYPTHI